MAQILQGAEVAQALDAETAQCVCELRERGVVPTLGIVRASNRKDCLSYVRGIRKRCESQGIRVCETVLPDDASEDAVIGAVRTYAADPDVHGVVVCQPVPEGVSMDAVLQAIPACKDVDGVTADSMMTVYNGAGEGFCPCAPEAAMRILKHYDIDVYGKNVVVIGDSATVGRPLWLLLLHAWATPTSCNIYTRDVPALTRQASVVISATGATDQFGAEYFSEGQVVIDVGIGYSERLGGISGDVRFDEVEPLVSAITPVPGGVGTVCASIMASHVAQAAHRQMSQ